MRKPAGFDLASVIALSALVCGGCLPAWQGSNDPSTGSGGVGAGSGTDGGGAGGGGGAPTDDLASSAVGDLGSGASGDLGGAAGGGDMAVVCDSLQSTAGLSSPSGHHNAGQECQGCHGGGGAPRFYVGGTLYSAATGGAAVAGATINVTDANGKTVKIVSANDGNFWTTTVLAYPIKVDASLCPSTVAMSATVSGNGACNNCHNSTMQVRVP